MVCSQTESGFTLLEALIAMAILAMVSLGFIGVRSSALADAVEGRNWRVAREIAEEKLSELRAGARELPPDSGTREPIEGRDGFFVQMVVGEAEIGSIEGSIAEADGGDQGDGGDRMEWQRERDRQRRADNLGMDQYEYEDHLFEERQRLLEDTIPSEDEFEDVAVVVYFPKTRLDQEGEDHFMLKAKVSTLAIRGWTPEQAESLARVQGDSSGGGGSPLGGGL